MARIERLARELEIPGRVWGDVLTFAERDARVTLDVDVVGPAGAPGVVLVPGLGMQRIEWPGSFVRSLVARGWRCILFDNRDCGPSQVAMARLRPTLPVYSISDMADDVVRVMDHLDLESAHVVGVSMGGIIAQRLAIRQPFRVDSLTSIMASTGAPEVGQADPAAKFMFKDDLPEDVRGFLHFRERVARIAEAPGQVDVERCHRLSLLAFARGPQSTGRRRQVLALASEPDRTSELRGLSVPTLAVHGADDRVVRPSGGLATAEAVPGGRYVELAGMSHALAGAAPMRGLSQTLADFLDEHRGGAGLAQRSGTGSRR